MSTVISFVGIFHLNLISLTLKMYKNLKISFCDKRGFYNHRFKCFFQGSADSHASNSLTGELDHFNRF